MNVLERLRAAFAAATPEGADRLGVRRGRPAEHRRQVRRLPGQRLHGDRQGAGKNPRDLAAERRRRRSTSPRWPARPRSPGPASSTSGSATTGSPSPRRPARRRRASAWPPPARPKTVVIDYSSPNVAKPMHVGPHPLDGHRREPGPDLRGPRPQGHPRQPPGRLGLAVRHDPLGLEERTATRPPTPPTRWPSWPGSTGWSRPDQGRREPTSRTPPAPRPPSSTPATPRTGRSGSSSCPTASGRSTRSTTASASRSTSSSARASTTRCSPTSSRTWKRRASPSRAKGPPSSSSRGPRPRSSSARATGPTTTRRPTWPRSATASRPGTPTRSSTSSTTARATTSSSSSPSPGAGVTTRSTWSTSPSARSWASDRRPFKTREGDVVGLESLLDEAVAEARKVVDENSPDLDPEEQRRRSPRSSAWAPSSTPTSRRTGSATTCSTGRKCWP